MRQRWYLVFPKKLGINRLPLNAVCYKADLLGEACWAESDGYRAWDIVHRHCSEWTWSLMFHLSFWNWSYCIISHFCKHIFFFIPLSSEAFLPFLFYVSSLGVPSWRLKCILVLPFLLSKYHWVHLVILWVTSALHDSCLTKVKCRISSCTDAVVHFFVVWIMLWICWLLPFWRVLWLFAL